MSSGAGRAGTRGPRARPEAGGAGGGARLGSGGRSGTGRAALSSGTSKTSAVALRPGRNVGLRGDRRVDAPGRGRGSAAGRGRRCLGGGGLGPPTSGRPSASALAGPSSSGSSWTTDSSAMRGCAIGSAALCFAAIEQRRLDGRPESDDLVRVDAHDRRSPEELLDLARHHGHPRRAADQDDAIELPRGGAGRVERLLADAERPLDERQRRPLELGARHPEAPRVRSRRARRAPGRPRRACASSRDDSARFISSARIRSRANTIGCARASKRCFFSRSSAMRSATTTSMSSPPSAVSPGRREHLEHVARQVEERHVERAAAEVVDGDALLRLALRPVGERRRRRLVQDAQHLEPRQPPGGLRRRALQIVEVRGHGDDRALDRLAERRLRDRLGLAQDERADLRAASTSRRAPRRPWRPAVPRAARTEACREPARTSGEPHARPMRRLTE